MDFTNTKEVTNTSYEAQNEEYRYSAEVTTQSGIVTVVALNIYQKVQDGRDAHAGYFVLRNSNKTISVPDGQPIMAHAQVFEDFLNFLQVEEPMEDPEPEQ